MCRFFFGPNMLEQTPCLRVPAAEDMGELMGVRVRKPSKILFKAVFSPGISVLTQSGKLETKSGKEGD